jgi:hypothetical protein
MVQAIYYHCSKSSMFDLTFFICILFAINLQLFDTSSVRNMRDLTEVLRYRGKAY